MWISCLLLLVGTCLSPVWGQSASCSGAFDFIFLIDSSASLQDAYNDSIIPFVESVSNNFINPDFRVSFITFDVPAILHLPLTPTEDREAIMEAIDSMRHVEQLYGTNIHLALDLAIEQIETNGGDSARVILAITDGSWVAVLTDRIRRLDELKAQRFIVAVGVVNEVKLGLFVDSEDHIFVGDNFQYLQEIIDLVIEKTCVEVTSIEPSRLCENRNRTDITLHGRGFHIKLKPNRAKCRFIVGSDFIVTEPVGTISDELMVCEDPGINVTGKYKVQVTLDGKTYITSEVKLEVADCTPGDDDGDDGDDDGGGGGGDGDGDGDGGDVGGGGKDGGGRDVDVGLVVGIVFGLIGLILLILLCCLWLCFPLITCRIVGGLPPEPEEKEPEPKPGRKWEIVDASYYGGGGIGGIKPVTVRWGKGGSTEEGNKLTKAKDAEVVEVVHEPGIPALPPKAPPGCWERFKKKLRRMYAVASSYRPVWGPTKRILWFPGTKPENKQPRPAPSKSTPAPLRNGSSTALLLPDGNNVNSPVRSAPPPPPPPPTTSSTTPPRAAPPRTRAPPPPPPPSINKPPIPSRPPKPVNS